MALILRITRHSLFEVELPEPILKEWGPKVAESNDRQRAELHRIFGEDSEIVERSGTFTVPQILELAEEIGADVIEAVLPPNMTAELTHPYKGFKGQGGVIRAQMSRHPAPFEGNDRYMVFLFDDSAYYERVVRVVVETERL